MLPDSEVHKGTLHSCLSVQSYFLSLVQPFMWEETSKKQLDKTSENVTGKGGTCKLLTQK